MKSVIVGVVGAILGAILILIVGPPTVAGMAAGVVVELIWIGFDAGRRLAIKLVLWMNR